VVISSGIRSIPARGISKVDAKLRLQAWAIAPLWSHCLLTQMKQGRHATSARVEICASADNAYREAQFHGGFDGIEGTLPAIIWPGSRARYPADSPLVEDPFGHADIDYQVPARHRPVLTNQRPN